jgi:hypothetical protein
MAAEISLFSGYDQPENRTTNYCLLVLKLLYEEHPRFLGEVIAALAGDATVADRVGVRFRQQRGIGRLVADGHIDQRPLHLYLETKHSDWFDDGKLAEEIGLIAEEHRDGASSVLLALANFDRDPVDRFPAARAASTSLGVTFAATSFEELLGAVREISVPKTLADTFDDFAAYLDDTGLLPSWKTRLDVVNCGRTAERVISLGAYACPAMGGAYNHARAKYFGVYKGKRVTHLAEIEAVVDVAPSESAVVWKQTANSSEELISSARTLLTAWGDDLMPGRVFVLGPLHETNFVKDSPGGMFGSKIYFDISSIPASSSEELAAALRDKVWRQLRTR